MIYREVIAALQCKDKEQVDTARYMKKTVEYLKPENLAGWPKDFWKFSPGFLNFFQVKNTHI